jgi:hypothetical protein
MALLAPALFAQQTLIGDVDSPDPSKVQTGMILVKGWALDPHTITKIELWVDNKYQHDALMFLPRIDIVEAFPDFPGIHTARPGFITGFLASNFSNGAHTIEMRILTSDGGINFIGQRTININNTINQAPFGFVDIPDGNGVYNVSGAFPVNGWAADTDGIQRVEVLVDDGVLQGAMHGDPRPDVAATFPDFPSAAFSGFVGNIDSTRIQNGVHTLTVRAIDRLGMSSLIGRRTIQVINNDLFLAPFGYIDEPLRDATLFGTGCGEGDDDVIISPPVRPNEHITPVRGWALDLGTRNDTGRVSYLELLVDGVPWLTTDDCAQVAGAFDNCYGLPRPDVARYYPSFPDAPRAGYLFTLDVGALLQLGVRPGSHRLSVRAGDREQTFSELPNRDGIPVFFQCVDENFNFPSFGFIEYPNTFDFVGGTVLVRGWALQDQASVVTLEIHVDGVYQGRAEYGYPRPDVSAQYPNIIDGIHSGWQFNLDTKKFANSRHRLSAYTVNSHGVRNLIGSVDFYTENGNAQP